MAGAKARYENSKMTRSKVRNENLKITQAKANQKIRMTRSKAKYLIENENFKIKRSKAKILNLKKISSGVVGNQNLIMTRSKAKTLLTKPNVKLIQSKAKTVIQNQNIKMTRSKVRNIENQNLKMTQSKLVQKQTLKVAPPKNINILPKELIVHIFKFLSIEDILRCESVCTLWKNLSQDHTIWRKFVIIYTHDPYHSRVNERNLKLVKTHPQFISRVKLQYIYDYSYLTSLLKKFKNIVSLEIISCQIDKDFAKRIRMWPTLKTLSFKNSPMEEECIFDFNKLPYLNYLALEYCGLSSINFDSLLSCNLSHIFIDQILDLTKEHIMKLIVARQEHLQSFRIYGGDSVDDTCLQLLGQCKQLQNLGIVKCGNLTDKGLVSLANLKNLRHLMLWHNNNFTEGALLSTLSNTNLYKIVTLGLVKIDRMSPVIVDMISENYKNLSSIVLSAGSGLVSDYEGQMAYKFRKNKLAFCMFFKYLF